jgi:hypothetical protein
MLGAGEKRRGGHRGCVERLGRVAALLLEPGSAGEAVPGEDSPSNGGGALMAAVSQFEGKRRGKEGNWTGK